MRATRSIREILLLAASVFFAVSIALSPTTTHADSAADVSISQAIPPSASSSACALIQVSDVHPFVYDGKLHSFDFMVNEPSYVALGGSVGDQPIDFQYITRWQGPVENVVRMHVDVTPVALTQDTPIRIVLISAAGQVTCIATVTTVIPKAINVPVYPTTPTGGNTHPVPPMTQPSSHPVVTPPSSSGTDGTPSGASSTATSGPMVVGALHSLGNLCQVGGASRLWIVLIVLYALFVLTLLLQKPDTFGERTLEWNIALILVLFLGLVAFWYLSLSCRTGPWAPALSTAIAVFGLICLLILGTPGTRPVFLLEEKDREAKKDAVKEEKKTETK